MPSTDVGTLASPTTVHDFSLDIRSKMTSILAGMILNQQRRWPHDEN
jgi:hypothetical protein